MQDQREPTLDEQAELNFAIDIRMAREEKKLSQAALARELDQRYGIKLDATAITRMERRIHGPDNARAIRLGEAVAIAEILDLSLNDLLKPDLDTRVKSAAIALEREKGRAQKFRTRARIAGANYLQLKMTQASENGDTSLAQEIGDLLDEESSLRARFREVASGLVVADEDPTLQEELRAQLAHLTEQIEVNQARTDDLIRRLTWSPPSPETTAPGFAEVLEILSKLPNLVDALDHDVQELTADDDSQGG